MTIDHLFFFPSFFLLPSLFLSLQPKKTQHNTTHNDDQDDDDDDFSLLFVVGMECRDTFFFGSSHHEDGCKGRPWTRMILLFFFPRRRIQIAFPVSAPGDRCDDEMRRSSIPIVFAMSVTRLLLRYNPPAWITLFASAVCCLFARRSDPFLQDTTPQETERMKGRMKDERMMI